ncbi:MAG TPA: ACP phosphodiesterase [Bacteroidia bacterium]|jgi:acyl carrier protein phosphodiesterase
MNFLSHLYLSGNSKGLLIGNYIADSVKGSAFHDFPEEIKKGIILHRNIDTFTDTHPIVEESKSRLRQKYKKYAGVIVDVYYDHYLAANWNDYSEISLDEYTKTIYVLIDQHKHTFPLKSQQFTHYMLEHNILSAYARLEGIERVLEGMSRRTTFQSNMEYAIADLKEHYHLFENEFRLFFPELKQFVGSKTEFNS